MARLWTMAARVVARAHAAFLEEPDEGEVEGEVEEDHADGDFGGGLGVLEDEEDAEDDHLGFEGPNAEEQKKMRRHRRHGRCRRGGGFPAAVDEGDEGFGNEDHALERRRGWRGRGFS